MAVFSAAPMLKNFYFTPTAEERGVMRGKKIVVILTLLLSVACVAGQSRADEKAKVKGMITTRTGETLVVKGPEGTFTVVLTQDTVTKDDRGLFGLDKEHLADTVLIPGLKVSVDGVSEEAGRVVAKSITVDGDDLEAAEMIQAGLHPTAEQVAANIQSIEANRQKLGVHEENIAAHQQSIDANRQTIGANRQQIEKNIKDIEENSNRFTQLSEYDVKAQATVRFKVGSFKVAPEDFEQLKQLAETATSIKGYIIEVMGFADASGKALVNERLSEDRAKAVISYLIQQCNVPVRHIVAPGAMGEYQPVSSNETEEGRADNRRVEVKVLVNKGIAGS
jgi:outer membrane protein OmpA-like peptidoglycan-associated protein